MASMTPAELAAADARVLTVTHRLAVANARVCRALAWLPGLELGMSSQYALADRAAMRDVLGIAARPTVSALAENGPAALAGLQRGDRVVAVDGVPMPADAPDAPASAEPVERASALLADALLDGAVLLDVERDGTRTALRLVAARGCAVRAVVRLAGAPRAVTDGQNIELTTGLLARTANDAEVAALIGHELAHVILDEREGSAHLRARSREDQADALGLVLAARAGYDPAAGAAFWTRFAQADRLGFLRSSSHRSASDRARSMAAMGVRIGEVGVEAADPLAAK